MFSLFQLKKGEPIRKIFSKFIVKSRLNTPVLWYQILLAVEKLLI